MAHGGRIAIVTNEQDFPDPQSGPGDFPVALGLHLTPGLMLAAYRRGIFAWTDDPVAWWSPDPRAVLELDGFHVSRSLARTLRKRRFSVTLDGAFGDVVRGCATARYPGDRTWISPRFAACFAALHRDGHAHSVECWEGERLVGGVFGVAVGGFFSAESMFHRATDASKVALFHLVEALRGAGYALLDVQVATPHTESLGAQEMDRDAYLRRVVAAVRLAPAALSVA